MKPIELLAPAKDYEHGCAAIDCGADALYIGAPKFGARSAAAVSMEDIQKTCRYAHLFGAKVYAAINTLIREEELVEAEAVARELCLAGVDALIVQDMAFMRMNLPPIEMHASTQTFNMTEEQCQFLSEAGFSRVVTERALSLEELAQLSQKTTCDIETFVHGAICVGFSGRCYLSRTTSTRSGNRGDCSQMCRLRYNLLDEDFRTLISDKYLLSVRDLNTTNHLGEMIDAGVSSFKIEGRLKEMGYVRNIVSHYRRQLDEILKQRPDLCRSSEGVSVTDFIPNPDKSFSRGATDYFAKTLRRSVASLDTPKSLGEYVGKVSGILPDGFVLDTKTTLSAGDGLCFITTEGDLIGTNVNRAEGQNIYPNKTDGIKKGLQIYRNRDHLFQNALERSRIRRKIDVQARVTVSQETIQASLTDGHNRVSTTAYGTFDTARNPEKATEAIHNQMSKTGESIYRTTAVSIDWDTERFVPISVLNDLRRELTQKLDTARLEAHPKSVRKAENPDIPYPETELSGEANVTNSLAAQFYKDHGVTRIETANDLRETLKDCRVMQTRYCLRREIGECLKEKSKYRGKLFLEHAHYLYELQFDCRRCGMDVIYRGKNQTKK